MGNYSIRTGQPNKWARMPTSEASRLNDFHCIYKNYEIPSGGDFSLTSYFSTRCNI